VVPFQGIDRRSGGGSDLSTAIETNVAGGVGIQVERAAGMKTERSGRALRRNGSLKHIADGLILLLSRYGAEDRASREQGRDRHRDGMSGDCRDRGETFVIDLLLTASPIERDDLHCEWIVEVGGRIVEGKMPVDANAAAHNVDGRSVEFVRIVGCRPAWVIARLDQMDRAKWQFVKNVLA
jgi:hypothetical protein